MNIINGDFPFLRSSEYGEYNFRIFVHNRRMATKLPTTSELVDKNKTHILNLLQFLDKYNWIWDVKMTDIFLLDHFSNIPSEWKDNMKIWTIEHLQQLPINVNPNWPQTIKHFVRQCQELSLTHFASDQTVKAIDILGDVARGMNAKKKHEVSKLSGLVKQVCYESQCQSVLDIGSGLGYLGNCLTQQCGLHVVGIEKEMERVATAQSRAHKLHNVSVPPKSISLNIDTSTECIESMTNLITALPGAVCVTGLHCCGDLTPALLHLFSSLSTLQSLVLVPCCYHKLSKPHLPLSDSLRQILHTNETLSYISIYGLRLAAQDSYKKWLLQSASDHSRHQRNVTYRAIAEVVLHDELIRPVADNLGRSLRKANFDTFDGFCSDFIKDVSQLLPDLETEYIRSLLFKTHDKFNPLFPLIEPFTGLQVCIQQTIESLILLDWLLFLQERDIQTDILVIFDDQISPRCMAIVSKKVVL